MSHSVTRFDFSHDINKQDLSKLTKFTVLMHVTETLTKFIYKRHEIKTKRSETKGNESSW